MKKFVQDVLNALKADPGSSYAEIALRAGIQKSLVPGALKELVKEGKIEVHNCYGDKRQQLANRYVIKG